MNNLLINHVTDFDDIEMIEQLSGAEKTGQ